MNSGLMRAFSSRLAANDFENVAAPNGRDVKFALSVFAQRRRILQREVALARRKQVGGDVLEVGGGAVVVEIERPDSASGIPPFRPEVIRENVNTAQIWDLSPAIDVAANHDLPGAVWIIERGIKRIWRHRIIRVSRILDRTFPHTPTPVLASARIRGELHVDFFAPGLADFGDVLRARL